VEYCIASRIGEISENDGVLFCEVPCLPRPPEQSSRYSRGEHYNGRCDSDLPAANRCDRAHTRGGPSRCPIYPGNRGDNRYPRRGSVSMNRGLSAESPRASRSLLIAVFRLLSKSTNVSAGQF